MTHDLQNRGPTFSAAFQSTGLTANPHDVIGITASTNSRVQVHELFLTQPSSEGTDLAIQVLRGSTAASTGAAITPRNIHGWPTVPTAGSAVTGPSTTLVSTASAVLLYSDGTSELRWHFKPAPEDRPIIDVGQRLHVRISAPTTGRLNGSIVFSETGKPAST